MKNLIVSDAISGTMPNEARKLYDFLANEIDFNEMQIKFDDNDNPLSFIVNVIIDDLPSVNYSLIADTFRQKSIYFKVLYAIKARMIERDEYTKWSEDEIKYGLAELSPPGIDDTPGEQEIDF